MRASSAVCSKVPETFGMKPFCIQHSMKLLFLTNSNRRLRNTEVKILRLITCCAKFLKFDWLKAVQLIRNCTAENNTESVQKL